MQVLLFGLVVSKSLLGAVGRGPQGSGPGGGDGDAAAPRPQGREKASPCSPLSN